MLRDDVDTITVKLKELFIRFTVNKTKPKTKC